MEQKPSALIIGVVLVVVLATTGGIYFFNMGPNKTPSEVVHTWIDVYPNDLKKAAPMTSKAMRQGLSLDDWIKTSQKTLGDFRYIKGKIVLEKVKGPKAEVLVDAEISSTLGTQLQKEQFRLTLVNNDWVIEERAVVMLLPSPPSFY